MSLAGKSSHGENENVIVVAHRSRCQIAAFYRYFRAVIRRLGAAQSIINRSVAGQQRPTSITKAAERLRDVDTGGCSTSYRLRPVSPNNCRHDQVHAAVKRRYIHFRPGFGRIRQFESLFGAAAA